MNKNLLTLFLVFLLLPANLSAEEKTTPKRRGLVTSTQCPYSCSDAGLSPENCIERQVGNTCQIEDLTQAPGHRSMIRVSKFEESKDVKVKQPKQSDQQP